MQIIAHRGLHCSLKEHNSEVAFSRAFAHGFGVEADVRERNGVLVLSHDAPTKSAPTFSRLLALHKAAGGKATLAINIKSDGLGKLLLPLLKKHGVKNYFLFDMSVPEALRYLNGGATCFTRQSEYETSPAFYDRAAGVWLDEFEGAWITEKALREHARHGKKLGIVSPELHGRAYKERWRFYQQMAEKYSLLLCTDHPQEAAKFFHE